MATKLADFLKAENEEYKAIRDDLRFYLDSYQGGSDYLRGGYLFSHTREPIQDFADRKRRVNYFNYCAPLVDIWLGHLYRQPIKRTSGSNQQRLDDFLSDVDLCGNSINAFMKEQSVQSAQIYGYSFVLVDKKPVLEDERTLADERRNGADVPYFSYIDPQAMINWALDRQGKSIWMRYVELVEEMPEWDSAPRKIKRYWTWTRQEWIIHEIVTDHNGKDSEVKEVSRETHRLGVVPIVTVYNRKAKDRRLVGLSPLRDIAPINRTIYNISSLIDEFLYRQCFNVLTMPKSGIQSDTEDIKLGTSNVLEYDWTEGMPAPQYLSPSVDPAQYKMEWIDRLIAQIFRLAKVRPLDQSSMQAISGESKRWDFHQENQSLNDKADNAQQAEIEMFRIWQMWQAQEPDIEIDYPEDFDIRGINEEIAEALELQTLPLGARFKSEYLKKLVRRIDSKLPDDILDEIDFQVDQISTAMSQEFLATTDEVF